MCIILHIITHDWLLCLRLNLFLLYSLRLKIIQARPLRNIKKITISQGRTGNKSVWNEGFSTVLLGYGWIKMFSDGCFRSIRMQEVRRAVGLRQLRVEQLSSLQHEVYMIRSIVVPGKHDIAALMLALKEAEIKAKAVPGHMHQG